MTYRTIWRPLVVLPEDDSEVLVWSKKTDEFTLTTARRALAYQPNCWCSREDLAKAEVRE